MQARSGGLASGAGQGNALIGYGTDMYTLEYELELGKPWANPDAWKRVSQPFFRADRIVTVSYPVIVAVAGFVPCALSGPSTGAIA